MTIKACEVFGGRDAVEAKMYAVIIDLSKEGIANSSQLPHSASEVLAGYDPDDLIEMCFVGGRRLDDLFPQQIKLPECNMQIWARENLGEGSAESNHGEMHTLMMLKMVALEEVLGPTKPRVIHPDEQEAIRSLRDTLDVRQD
jgi:hypothetical protein